MERPLPPPHLTEAHRLPPSFVPAPEVWDWIQRAVLAETGPLYNPDHGHLLYAEIGVLWTNVEMWKGGGQVAATMEVPIPRDGNEWQKERRRMQLREWFPEQPDLDFLLTIDAALAAQVDDVSWCCLIDGHELYHAAQAKDRETQEPLWTKDERPRFRLDKHDVEVFVGGAARYGPVERNVAELVRAVNAGPTIAPARIGLACGTCNRMVA